MDLGTRYLGIDLPHPLVVSACNPLSRDLDACRRAEDAGAAALVMFSLFEEEIRMEEDSVDFFTGTGIDSFAEASDYFPTLQSYATPVERYFDHLGAACEALDIPVFGSLSCVSLDGWSAYAPRFAEVGAAGLELNIYNVITDPDREGRAVETLYREIVAETRRLCPLPLAVKLHPFFSSLPAMARDLCAAGADGLVLFNRFYQPDIDIEGLEVDLHLHLSSSRDLLLPLRWTAILDGRVPADLAISGGVHTPTDVIKGVLAGAAVTMLASELLAHGLGRIDSLREGIERWMEAENVASLRDVRGSMSQRHVTDPAAYERAQHMRILRGYRVAEEAP